MTSERQNSLKPSDIIVSNNKHVRWQPSIVTCQDRQNRNGHRSFLVWLTGLPGSGKSTLAYALDQQLFNSGFQSYVLDGDNVRHGLCSDLGFSELDRAENLRRVAEMAKLLIDAGIITIAAFVSPHQAERAKANALIGQDRFLEIYCRCPVKVCESRDNKGNYAKARAGIILNFTGISAPYEPPEHPAITIDTSTTSIDKALTIILELIQTHVRPEER